MKTVILVVDDSESMRKLIRMTLKDVAEIVGECVDGADALAQYERLRPDYVLMDIGMKNIDGITATRQIIAAHPAAKIIIVTDYDDDALRSEAREAGASHYIFKENLLDILEIL